MNTTNNKLLIDFPVELQYQIAEYLTIKDLNNCLRVCRVWKNLFDSDIMWKPIAKKLRIKKLEINSIHRFLIETPIIFNWIPNKFKDYLANDFKSLIHKKIILEEENIKNNYPKEFFEVFGGATSIQQLPAIEITIDDLIHIHKKGYNDRYYFKDEHFSSPIVRALLKTEGNPHFLSKFYYFILFRIINNETGKIYRDAITFASFFGIENRVVENSMTRRDQRIIWFGPAQVTKSNLNRLQRIIQRESVGIIVSGEKEGPRTTSNGKSVLELC